LKVISKGPLGEVIACETEGLSAKTFSDGFAVDSLVLEIAGELAFKYGTEPDSHLPATAVAPTTITKKPSFPKTEFRTI
jgi:hypothetical protein